MNTGLTSLPTPEFLDGIDTVASKFDSAHYPQHNLPADDWALLVKAGVRLPVLPTQYGGRYSHVEMCEISRIASEKNLALGVLVTVNNALGLRPVVRWGSEEAKREILPLFAGNDPLMAGMAATEVGCGSALSSITTTFEEVEGGYRIRGRKHWQALSYSADCWVVLARSAHTGEFGYFIVKRSEGFRTVERYEPLGLKLVDYGINDIDAIVPEHRRISAQGTGLATMVEILLVSRAMMAAMGCGFLRRLSHEARAYADQRMIGREPLSSIRYARYRLAAIDASYTICEALNHYLLTALDFRTDMAPAFPAVQSIKTVATERMLSAAHHYQQLAGGEGYRCGSPTNVAGQAWLDSRVFTIFDGNNDLLSQQLAKHCLTLARRGGQPLTRFLANWPLTAPAFTKKVLPDLRFLDLDLNQEHLVLAGRAIAYLFTISQVIKWAAETDTDAGRVDAAIEFLAHDIASVVQEWQLLGTGILDDPRDGAVDAPSARSGFARLTRLRIGT